MRGGGAYPQNARFIHIDAEAAVNGYVLKMRILMARCQ
jgi:hypothetical protein